MSSFIIRPDYFTRLDPISIDQIVGSFSTTDPILDRVEEEVEQEIRSILSHRFSLDGLFGKTINLFDTGVTYGDSDFVYVAPTTVLDDAAVADTFNINTYAIDRAVDFGMPPTVYRAIANGVNNDYSDPAKWERVGYYGDIYKALVAGPPNILTDAASWSQEDPRDALLVGKMVPIIIDRICRRLHPRQVPEHRAIEAEDAMKFLVNCADPRKNITPTGWTLKTQEDQKGLDISYGSGRSMGGEHEIY